MRKNQFYDRYALARAKKLLPRKKKSAVSGFPDLPLCTFVLAKQSHRQSTDEEDMSSSPDFKKMMWTPNFDVSTTDGDGDSICSSSSSSSSSDGKGGRRRTAVTRRRRRRRQDLITLRVGKTKAVNNHVHMFQKKFVCERGSSGTKMHFFRT